MARAPQNRTKYDALVLAVATGVSVIDWCRETGTSRSTASLWQSDPDFDADVAMIRRQMLNRAVGKFTSAINAVADGMIKLAESAEGEPTKLAAQKAVIENMIQVVKFSDFEQRLAALEAANDGQQHEGTARAS